MIRVVIRGYAAVSRRDGEAVTDPAVLRTLDGLADDVLFTDYLWGTPVEQALAAALEPGGVVAVSHRGADPCLTLTTEYRSRRPLAHVELAELVDHTVAHWFNGIGRSVWVERPLHPEYDILCLWSEGAVASYCPGCDSGAEYPVVEVIAEQRHAEPGAAPDPPI